ncbi:sensor histidine kinase [Paucibacter sp. JuS9]|uniref:sensor histidine kinase n=1 Tax=Paucibacter sp. JuS9 TaxID=3228748 RepID=UPI0037574EAD
MKGQAKQAPSLGRRMIAWQGMALLLAWPVLSLLLSYRQLYGDPTQVEAQLRDWGGLLVEAARGPADGRQHRLDAAERALVRAYSLDQLGEQLRPRYQLWSADERQLLARSAEALDPAEPSLSLSASDGQLRLHIGAAPRPPDSVLPVLAQVLPMQLGVFIWHGLWIWLSVRWGLMPLRQLAQRIAQRRAGDLTPLMVDRSYAETAPVVSSLNALLQRESQRLDAERNFLADAAHELRTPLAAVSAQAHLLLQEPEPDARRDAATALRQGIERVSHLLAQLLTMARAEARDDPAKQAGQRLDLAELLRERAALLAPLARGRHIELSLQAPDELYWLGERSALHSVIDNLLDNAIRYTPPGGRVEASLRARPGGELCLSVADDGPGIALAEQERVFERFYRVAGNSETGTGLGLAIARRMAQRLRGRIEVGGGLAGRGVGFSLILPLPAD